MWVHTNYLHRATILYTLLRQIQTFEPYFIYRKVLQLVVLGFGEKDFSVFTKYLTWRSSVKDVLLQMRYSTTKDEIKIMYSYWKRWFASRNLQARLKMCQHANKAWHLLHVRGPCLSTEHISIDSVCVYCVRFEYWYM